LSRIAPPKVTQRSVWIGEWPLTAGLAVTATAGYRIAPAQTFLVTNTFTF